LPVHSAHVGQELEVHYRYHPYFGRKVLVRRMEQRATGQFLSVQGPAGIVVSIAGWMLDPVICAGMTIGAPRVDLAALVELERLLIVRPTPRTLGAMSQSFGRKAMKSLRLPAAAPSRQMNFLFDNSRLEGVASAERDKIILVLAQILMQAAGLSVEELEDDQR
jgi:hypothetical protein